MGAGQKVIASLLGHSDSATTERYHRPERDHGTGRGTRAAAWGRGGWAVSGDEGVAGVPGGGVVRAKGSRVLLMVVSRYTGVWLRERP